jgi:hypothetical protein
MPRQLTVTVDQRTLTVSVPDNLLAEAESFFAKMDRDMDRGWQMGPEFVENPNREQRAQIAANKLLVSLSSADETMVTLMAGYILARLPGVSAVDIDTGGEMLNTQFTADTTVMPEAGAPAGKSGLGKREALAQAGKEVSAVYRAGSGYRFAVLDRTSGQRRESPLFSSESQAIEARLLAFRRRYEELLGQPALN